MADEPLLLSSARAVFSRKITRAQTQTNARTILTGISRIKIVYQRRRDFETKFSSPLAFSPQARRRDSDLHKSTYPLRLRLHSLGDKSPSVRQRVNTHRKNSDSNP